MNNRRFLLGFSIVLLIAAALTVFYIYSRRIPFNDDYVVGNTAGNLNNGGLFLELNGKVYFSNPLGNNCLYSMNPDETDIKELTMMSTRNIVGAGKHLYFYMDNSKTGAPDSIKGLGRVSTYYGLYRAELDGQEQKLLSWNKISDIQLVGNTLYYTITSGDDPGLNSMRIDGKDHQLVTTEKINPNCVSNGAIYYRGVDLDYYLHRMDTLQDNMSSTVLTENVCYPIVQGDYVYYTDAAKSKYRLTRTNLTTMETQVLSDVRVDFFNMNENNIFFVTSTPGMESLRVINLDGSGETIIAEGTFNSLNLTSKYLYFKPFGVDNVLYHVPVDGSAQWSTFLTY